MQIKSKKYVVKSNGPEPLFFGREYGRDKIDPSLKRSPVIGG
jgi:hypothetical protein